MYSGGEGGIRTHEELAPLVVFKTTALDQLCDLSMISNLIHNAESVGVEPTRDYSSRRFSEPVHYRSAHSPL